MASEDDLVLIGKQDIEDFNSAGILPQSPEEIKRIQDWLQPTEYSSESSEYSKHLASYATGTGNWIQDTEQFRQWSTRPDYGTLLIKAMPGAGKSVVAAHLAHQLSEVAKAPVLRFFFRQIITTNKTPQSLVRDWLSQVLNYSPSLQLRLKELREKNRALDSLAIDDLWNALLNTLSDLPQVYCVADALDEMDMGNEAFMRKLIQLGQQKPSSIKVLMTSRILPRIERILNHTSVLQITLRPHMVSPDITKYVASRLTNSELPEEAKCAIQKTVCIKAQGLFLYARLMMDEVLLEGKHTLGKIQDAVEKLPNGLGDMYTRLLKDHSVRSGVSEPLQLLILQWVTHSSRPLRLLEIAAVVDFVRKTTTPDLVVQANGVPQDTKSIIRAACGPLLEILEDETVSIIHHSFTEFLVDSERTNSAIALEGTQFPTIIFADAQKEMSKICIKYLLSGWSKEWVLPHRSRDYLNPINPEFKRSRMKYPFLEYAICYYDFHIRQYNTADKSISELLDQLMEPSSKVFLSCLDIMSKDDYHPGKTALSLSSSKGLCHYVEHLLENGCDINKLGPKSRTALHMAAKGGHFKVVDILLRHGASPNMDDREGLTPLHAAASRNHSEVVKLLLKAGVDPQTPKTKESSGRTCGNAPRTSGQTPLQYACQYGHTETVRTFLPYLSESTLSKALCWAAGSGRTESVFAILDDHRIDVNCLVNGQTALHLAANSHDAAAIAKLLDMGSDVNVRCTGLFGTQQGVCSRGKADDLATAPLIAFARGNYGNSNKPSLKALQLLLSAGSDINAVDSSGGTALHYAISAGRRHNSKIAPEVLQLLLDSGANVSAANDVGSTPLHIISHGSANVIQLLIDHGADVNAVNKDGCTPIFYSIRESNDENFMAFIENNADCNIQDNNGDSLLHLAARDFSEKNTKIKTLIQHGASPNLNNKKGETPMHVMNHVSDEILQLFVAAHADLEAKTEEGFTVGLKHFARSSFRSNIKEDAEKERLLKAGARLDSQDFQGQTCLHLLCHSALSAQAIRHLVGLGADPSQRDFFGNTLFHKVARQPPDFRQKEQLDLLNTLLDIGVSPSERNHAGQTPFHIAASMRRQNTSSYKTDPYEFLLGSNCKLDVNDADNKGVRPIHLAASLGEAQVRRLLDKGADPCLFTTEEQSILHIACRARQSNIVGFMVEHYAKLGRTDVVDHIDRLGRTALHYACRSGRYESVQILLDGGANPNIKDTNNLSPLDMCVEAKVENVLWNYRACPTMKYSFPVDACSILLTDSRRPYNPNDRFDTLLGSDIKHEHETIGVRPIIRLLVAYGADVSFMDSANSHSPTSGRLYKTFDRALSTDCEVVIDELLCIKKNFDLQNSQRKMQEDMLVRTTNVENSISQKEKQLRQGRHNLYIEKHVSMRLGTEISSYIDILKIDKERSPLSILSNLLRLENERGIVELYQSSADLIKPAVNYWPSVVSILAYWGYASILHKIHEAVAKVEPDWLKPMNDPNWEEQIIGAYPNYRDSTRPVLFRACERVLPNLEVVKFLVERTGVDVNCRDKEVPGFSRGSKTVLHVLAGGQHWWQSKALEYLAQHGADVNAKDRDGTTPLHVAVQNNRARTTELLLRYGADPNILTEDGRSCLNSAGSNSEIVRILIKHGADFSSGKRPFIFDAIESMNLDIVDLLVEIDADCNTRTVDRCYNKANEDDSDEDSEDYAQRQRRRNSTFERYIRSSIPLHFAISSENSTPDQSSKMIPIIQSLLKGGANPLLEHKKGQPIIHYICEFGGILEPFLDTQYYPNLDTETRDSKGRTLLLAACSNTDSRPTSIPRIISNLKLLFNRKANIQAIDTKRRNTLHHLLKRGPRLVNSISKKESVDLILSYPEILNLVNQKDNTGYTPLHYALRNGHTWAINILLDKGADPIEPDPNGNTALHHLAKTGTTPPRKISIPSSPMATYLDINKEIPIFTAEGANISVINNKGQNLLHVIAGKNGNNTKIWVEEEGRRMTRDEEMFKWLMSRGLDPMAEDCEQRTSLDFAAVSDQVEILELFRRKV